MTRPAEDVPELVEVSTIAQRFGVHDATVRYWVRRNRRFPKPCAWLMRGVNTPGAPLWQWDRVWAFVQEQP